APGSFEVARRALGIADDAAQGDRVSVELPGPAPPAFSRYGYGYGSGPTEASVRPASSTP
ncbi:hypothetical protein AB0M29_26410, partial [Streptomyces sp. NPDC051976]